MDLEEKSCFSRLFKGGKVKHGGQSKEWILVSVKEV